jgi:hypothetical protein
MLSIFFPRAIGIFSSVKVASSLISAQCCFGEPVSRFYKSLNRLTLKEASVSIKL